MSLYKTKAIVLKDYDLKEQDKIVIFYSLKYGKIRIVAKGGRKIKSKFAPAIQPPSYLNLLVYRYGRDDLDILSESWIVHPFLGIRRDLVRFAYSSYIAELVIKLSAEREASPALFYLILKILFLMEKIPKRDLPLLIRSFELKSLSILGYKPSLENCIYCGEKVEEANISSFGVSEGGIICESCQKRHKRKLNISRETIKALKFLLYSNPEKSTKLRLEEKVQREVEKLLKDYLLYRIGDKMLTSSFIDNFKNLEEREG